MTEGPETIQLRIIRNKRERYFLAEISYPSTGNDLAIKRLDARIAADRKKLRAGCGETLV